jgi:hypothetical protein
MPAALVALTTMTPRRIHLPRWRIANLGCEVGLNVAC